MVASTKTLMTISENTQWKSYSVHIVQLVSGYQVRISANSSTYPFIQPYIDQDLDNIKFVDCDPNAKVMTTNLNCDFENGTCGWFDMNMGTSNQIDWVREDSYLIF